MSIWNSEETEVSCLICIINYVNKTYLVFQKDFLKLDFAPTSSF